MKNKEPNWTLFLDRDGVINRRIPDDYVKNWGEFKFLPHVLSSLKKFNSLFHHILVVTNQAGIGKGLMTEPDLSSIHKNAHKIIRKHGGRIDAFYHCPTLSQVIPNCRKPSPAMGLWARNEFPDIDFSHSVMIGDSASDIEFGKGLGMITVMISGKEQSEAHADFVCQDLHQFYRIFVSKIAYYSSTTLTMH